MTDLVEHAVGPREYGEAVRYADTHPWLMTADDRVYYHETHPEGMLARVVVLEEGVEVVPVPVPVSGESQAQVNAA